MQSQPLATLVDLELPGCSTLQVCLLSRIKQFAKQWLSRDAFGNVTDLIFAWQIDNFGVFGTVSLLQELGVSRMPEADFEVRAEHRIKIEDANRSHDWRQDRFFYKERVYCYVEYALQHPFVRLSVGILEGSLLKENSFHGEGSRAGRAGLLRSMTLPISDLVDRTLCAEYQALSEICDLTDSLGVTTATSRYLLTGFVKLWTLGPSCLSCVGIIRQFVVLFPNIKMEVVCGRHQS